MWRLGGAIPLVRETGGRLTITSLGSYPGVTSDLSKTGAELLFELISQRYERSATLITSNLPFDEWTETFGSERLTGALLDRLTHHVSILEMNGDSYRLGQSRARKTQAAAEARPKRLALTGHPGPTVRKRRAEPPNSGVGRWPGFPPPLTPLSYQLWIFQ